MAGAVANNNISELISKTRTAFISNDSFSLKKISNNALRFAVIRDDKSFAEVGVVAYALMKISSKQHIRQDRAWDAAKKRIEERLSRAESVALAGNTKRLSKEMLRLDSAVSAVDSRLGHYVISTIAKAKLKLASSAYALGMSLGSASDLTGADKKELMGYIGGTMIHDEEGPEIGIDKRVKRFNFLLGK